MKEGFFNVYAGHVQGDHFADREIAVLQSRIQDIFHNRPTLYRVHVKPRTKPVPASALEGSALHHDIYAQALKVEKALLIEQSEDAKGIEEFRKKHSRFSKAFRYPGGRMLPR